MNANILVLIILVSILATAPLIFLFIKQIEITEPVCGDNICENIEKVKGEFGCPADCKTKNGKDKNGKNDNGNNYNEDEANGNEPLDLGELLSVKDIEYGTHDRQKLDVYYDENFNNVPAVIVLHGGGGNKEGFSDFAPTFHELGFVSVIINYRIQEVQFPTPFNDAQCALAWAKENVEQYGGDPNKIIITGNSGGAHTGGMISYRSEKNWLTSECLTQYQGDLQPYAFIGLAGHYDFDFVDRKKFDTLSVLLADSYSDEWDGDDYVGVSWGAWEVTSYVDSNDPPALLIVGDNDGSNKFKSDTNSHEMSRVLDSNDVFNELYIVENGGHGGPKTQVNNPSNTEMKNIISNFLEDIGI